MMKFVAALLLVSAALSVCTGQTLTQVTQPVEHAEGPHWDADLQVLYFVDINDHKLYKWDPASPGQVTYVDLGGAVGFAIPVDGPGVDRFMAGRDHDLVYADWTGDANVSIPYDLVPVLATVDTDADQGGNRFNDAKADAVGRLWAGTMGLRGSLYSLDPNSTQLQQKLTDVATSNGIAWNSDNTIMYYIDTGTDNVDALDFNLATGDISNRRTVFSLRASGLQGSPDGMTIDTDGNLWVALWGGQSVIKVDPTTTNHLLLQVALPAVQVTSVAFGGDNLATLYVTTSRAGLSSEQLAQQPLAGAVFAVDGLGVAGYRSNRVLREV